MKAPLVLLPVAVVPGSFGAGFSWCLFKVFAGMVKLSLADRFLRGLYPIFSRSPAQIFLDSSSDFCFSGLERN